MSSVSMPPDVPGTGAGHLDLDQRYGRGRSKWPIIVPVVILAVVFLAWLAWAAAFHSRPTVSSELIGFEVTSDHETEARIDVAVAEGTENALCLVRALAEDHAIVGEVSWEPTDGPNTVVIRTERLATAAEQIGCTAHGQNRPR